MANFTLIDVKFTHQIQLFMAGVSTMQAEAPCMAGKYMDTAMEQHICVLNSTTPFLQRPQFEPPIQITTTTGKKEMRARTHRQSHECLKEVTTRASCR